MMGSACGCVQVIMRSSSVACYSYSMSAREPEIVQLLMITNIDQVQKMIRYSGWIWWYVMMTLLMVPPRSSTKQEPLKGWEVKQGNLPHPTPHSGVKQGYQLQHPSLHVLQLYHKTSMFLYLIIICNHLWSNATHHLASSRWLLLNLKVAQHCRTSRQPEYNTSVSQLAR